MFDLRYIDNRAKQKGDLKMFFGKRFFGYQGKSFSGLDILVLSIIKNKSDEKGISGYTLMKEINATFGEMWKVSAGTIYPLLERLHTKGYVEIIELNENNRDIKYYKISVEGDKRLKNILDDKLEGNFLKVLDYVRTVISGIPTTFTEKFEDMCSCFPSHHGPSSCGISEDHQQRDVTKLNLTQIKTKIVQLENVKKRLNSNIKNIDTKIIRLKERQTEIEKSMKHIEISDDEENF